MKIKVWPADDGACGWYRLKHPAMALIAQGANVELGGRGPMAFWDQPVAAGRSPRAVGITNPINVVTRHFVAEAKADVRLMGLAEPIEADVVVIQRPISRYWSDLIPHIQASGVRVVVDVDDRFDRIHAENVAVGAFDPRKQMARNHWWIDLACKRADLVTCSTPALAERYGYGHAAILPNLVPDEYLYVNPWTPRPKTIGWGGIVDTHPGDLEVTGGSVRSALINGWTFHTIGTGEGIPERLHIEETTATGLVPFEEYASRIAELAVGIVPLALNIFNQSKSALKLAEYAALGVAAVGSPTPDNRRLHALGVGLLASTPNQWRRHLARLTKSDEFRADVAGRSREAMATQTYPRHAHRWVEAWESTVTKARRAA